MKKILITGATGMLGMSLSSFLRKKVEYRVVTHGMSLVADYQMDLTNLNLAINLIDIVRPDVIINLIGLTNVDSCESNIHRAYAINVSTIENIVHACKRLKFSPYLIQASTDHNYDGIGLHKEDSVTISNVYGLTKYASELAALTLNAAVIRINFIGKSLALHRESFTDWVYRSCTNGLKVQAYDDIFFSPLSLKTLSILIMEVLEREMVGVFNLGSHQGMSKADAIFLFADHVGLRVDTIFRTNLYELPNSTVKRPKNMQMNLDKFILASGLSLPTLEDEIIEIAREYVV